MSKVKPAQPAVEEKPKEYKYTTEISQMVRDTSTIRLLAVSSSAYKAFQQMFVFGEVQDPLVETVNLVEDIVRSQVLEIVSLSYLHRRMVAYQLEISPAGPSSPPSSSETGCKEYLG